MYVGRTVKETPDVSRFTVDFTPWLDVGETIASVTNQTVIQGAYGWSTTPPRQTPAQPPYDPTPIIIASLSIITSSTQVQVFFEDGTPGMTYTIQFVAWGTSGRHKTVEVGVQVTGTPPTPPLYNPAAPPFPLPSYLPIDGGQMTGPLLLFRDPQTTTEAATKEYVDTLTTSAISDTAAEAVARAAADAINAAAIVTETARAEGEETTLLGYITAARSLVVGAGLNGGTIALSGTAIASSTISANYQAGTLTTFHAGLTLNAGTLAPDWNGGVVEALGAGVALASGTLSAGGSGGTVTEIFVAGSGIKTVGGGPITTNDTLEVEWNAGTVTAIDSSLTITSGTLGAVFPAQEWVAGTVSAIGNGLTISGGTISAIAGTLDVFGTITDETTSRGYGTIYTNSNLKPIFVYTSGTTDMSGDPCVTAMVVNGTTLMTGAGENGDISQVSGLVPSGATYEIVLTGSITTLGQWTEIS